MDKETAKTLLSFHSGRNDDINNPKWKNGFLGSLRPFRGELIENNFFEVMECLRVLKDDFSKPMVDKNVVSEPVEVTRFESDLEKLGELYWLGYNDAEGQIEEIKAYLEG